MTYRAVRSSRGRGMAGTALRRLLTCDRISRTLRLVDSCLDAIWSMTRGMRTWRKRSSLTSSVKPRAVRALLSAASSSASVGAGDAISDALRLRSVVTIPTFAIRPVLPGADASDGTDLRLRSRSRTHKKPLSALSVILSIFTRVPAPGYIPVSTHPSRSSRHPSRSPSALTHSTLFARTSRAPSCNASICAPTFFSSKESIALT